MTSKQRAFLRGLANTIDAIFQVGKGGISDNLIKQLNDALEAKEQHNIERFSDENYTISGRGKKARPCIYKGKEYKSRQECIYKEGITKYQLYEYLKKTNQV